MKKHDESRRAFLIGAAVGAAATTAFVPDAIAQTHELHGVATTPRTPPHTGRVRGTAHSSTTTTRRRSRPSPSG
jgi:hypothetical protein